MNNVNPKTMDIFTKSVTESNGITKLPGTIVHVPSPARRVAINRGWLKKCGERDVLTVSGYNAA